MSLINCRSILYLVSAESLGPFHPCTHTTLGRTEGTAYIAFFCACWKHPSSQTDANSQCICAVPPPRSALTRRRAVGDESWLIQALEDNDINSGSLNPDSFPSKDLLQHNKRLARAGGPIYGWDAQYLHSPRKQGLFPALFRAVSPAPRHQDTQWEGLSPSQSLLLAPFQFVWRHLNIHRESARLRLAGCTDCSPGKQDTCLPHSLLHQIINYLK